MAAPFAVIGAGVIGLSTAYYLRQFGLDVVVLEQRHPGSGASHGNAGWIVPSLSAPLPGPGMLRTAAAALRNPDGAVFIPPRHLPGMLLWGLRFATACTAKAAAAGTHATARLGTNAMDLYDALRADGVEFEMRAAGLLEVFDNRPAALAAAQALTPLHAYGYQVPDVLDEAAVHMLEPALGPAVRAGILIEGERAVDPRSLVDGLRKRLDDMQVPVMEEWPVTSIDWRHGQVRAVAGSRGTQDVSGVVVAAGAWSGALLRQLNCHVHLKGGKGYSLSIRPELAPIRPIYASAVKVAATPLGGAVRLAGTMEIAGLDGSLDPRRLEAMKRAITPYLRGWDPATETAQWCGLRPMTPDGLPVIGRLPGIANAYVATGHAMLGVTLAPSTGRAVAALVTGREDGDLLTPFRADRPGARALVPHRRARSTPAG